jgi:hypothetical protein
MKNVDTNYGQVKLAAIVKTAIVAIHFVIVVHQRII